MTTLNTFDDWWEFTGQDFGIRIAAAAKLQRLQEKDHVEQVRALCSVSYHQGRIDESNKTLTALEKMTKLRPGK